MTKRIGIIGAMEKEVATLIAALSEHREETIGGIVYHTGKLGEKEVVVAQSGAGKVNAALTVAEMIRTFFASAVINTGVAGALEDTLRPEDAVVASDLVQHDYDTSPLGDEPGFVSGVRTVRFPVDPVISAAAVDAARSLGMRVLTGTIATGDLFVSSSEQKERIKRLFGAYACEMEGAAVAHACLLYGVRCAVIRTISDRADGKAQIDFPTFVAHAAALNAEIVKRVVETL